MRLLACLGPALLLASLLLAPGVAVADEPPTSAPRPLEPNRLGEAARRGGMLCRAGQLDEAEPVLRDLYRALVEELGATHSATRVVELSWVAVRKARGEPAELSPARDGIREVQALRPDLEAALQKLRPCASLLPGQRAAEIPSDSALEFGPADVGSQLRAAHRLAARGQYRAAVAAAERAHALAREQGKSKPLMEASEALALLRLQLGDRDAAVEAAREAEALAVERGALMPRISLSRLLAQAQRLDEAEALLESIREAALADPQAAPEFAEAVGDLALRLGAPRRALASLELALAGHEARFGGQHTAVASALMLRGDANRMLGDLPAARDDYARALSIRTQALGERHPETARTLNAVGVLHADFGDFAEADAAFARSLAILSEELGAEHPEVITVRSNRALVAWTGSRSEASADEYAGVVEALAQSYGAGHPSVTDATRNLARMQEELGDRQRAESLLRLALTSQLRALGEGHPALAPTRMAHGRFLARAGRLEDAEAELDRAVELLRGHFGDEHPLVARAHTVLARVLAARGQADEAWAEARLAGEIFDLHIHRSFGAMPDRHRELVALDAGEVIGALISVPGVPARDVYQALIPHRDSVLRSIAATRATARGLGDDSRAALAELAALREQYVAAVLSDSPGAAGRAAELARSIDAQETVVALMRGAPRALDAAEVMHRACARLPADAALIEFVAYDRGGLGAVDQMAPSYVAFVTRVRRDAAEGPRCRVERIDLGVAGPIDAAADGFAAAMRAQQSDAPGRRARLSALLLEPLREAVDGSSRWLVVPDGPLWGVPLAALPDPEAPDRYLAERVTLGMLNSIHELADPSAATDGLAQSRPEAPTAARPPDPLDANQASSPPAAVGAPEAQGAAPGFRVPAGALLFGAPDFGAPEASDGPVVLTATGPCRIAPFEPLPATRYEIDEIGAMLPGARKVVGADATKARLQQELRARPPIVHLATHAYFAGNAGCDETPSRDPREEPAGPLLGRGPVSPNPLLLSGIVFAGANAPRRVAAGEAAERASGILTAYEAAGLDLSSAKLVVLSACDTGTGLHKRGQEIQGLRWGFRAAGARAMVTSLWRSNDAVTRRLMRSFYASLSGGALAPDLFRGADALRHAQLERIEGEKRLGTKKPLLWANFVFSGIYAAWPAPAARGRL